MKQKATTGEEGNRVTVKNGNIESALRVFKSKVYNSGKIKEVYDRQFYVKDSVKKRKEKLKAMYVQKMLNDYEKDN